MKRLLLICTHVGALAIGFALGIYSLPILTAPESPSDETVSLGAGGALFSSEFRRDLEGSDLLHWGEGQVYIHNDRVTFSGELAPGPDYYLYFSPDWIETEEAFSSLKPQMVRVGRVSTFENFVVELPAGFQPGEFTTVVVWCESFGQFITAARYQ